MTAQVIVYGVAALQTVIDVMDAAASSGELGKIFSIGADQGYGPYEHYVQSDERQTSKHATTGWRTDEEAVLEFEPEAEKMMIDVFNQLGRGAPKTAFVEGVRELINDVYEWISWYPPVPAGSKYMRTRTLYKSWYDEVYV